jgi:phage shock protein A
MGLFQRIGAILSANLHELVEKLEDPEAILRQAIREMEIVIEEARQETARAMASATLVRRGLEDQERLGRDWQQRAEQAVRGGDDGLARTALARKQEADRLAAALRDQLQAADEASRTLRRQLEAMQVKLAEARRRLCTYAARKKAADVRARMDAALAHPTATPPGVFEQFERLRARVERMEAEADALRELDERLPTMSRAATTLPGESVHRESETDVEGELAALKKRLGR